MYGPEVSAIINGAEQGLTHRETAKISGMSYYKVKKISKKLGIEFVCARRKANEQRFRKDYIEDEKTFENNDNESNKLQALEPQNGTGRVISNDGNDQQKFGKIKKMIMDYETVYATRLMNFEKDQARQRLRPPLPLNCDKIRDSKNIRINPRQNSAMQLKRIIIMDLFTKDKKLTSHAVAGLCEFTTQSSGQILNLLFREDKLVREQVYFGPNVKDAVYVYSLPGEI